MNKQIAITPTIGRRVWYIPSTYERDLMGHKPSDIGQTMIGRCQPCDAHIVRVWHDRLVDLSVTDHNDNVHTRTSVTLYQAGDTIATHAESGFAVWPDYDLQQAQPKPQGTTTGKYFAFAHLPAHLQIVSKPLAQLAELLEQLLPSGPELSAGMRKLLEAKDCFVRAALDLSPAELLARAPITDSDRLDLVLRAGCGMEVPDIEKSVLSELAHADDDLTPSKAIAVLDAVIKQQRAPQQLTEEPDHAQD